ncbi:glycine cleavage system protein H [Mesotoga sp. Brook.08.YT.4.2.5.1]|jgi:glycine cleavage system H protein|uniref:Glycine cleavage system H protein n=1 Tax=Mesotoga infera TaxID=1236046 RepID=A0A117M882_9BACT|nr:MULTISPECIES: glycine cleavage system protein GcvH [unclassified Mesotoga]KUK89784.1 MAG: Glycine cleavage system H protein [Mesotoga infera]PNQ04979.1 glycine cleavage system protein H [Mesotoga sp. SC_NapDC3]PXF33893.1 glycine cleavage system protein H [Mesotoga sp. SC_NapDC]RAM59129.1 glycine cleavage system protein H [Mesotoga sp. SC_3PWM13N19]RIZ60986.1 glycine cleavage system protein H [Mesotoga sp. SC_NapDC2]
MKKFAATHEWVSIEGKVATVGISDHAQDHLGDIVYVDLPEVGKSLKKGDVFCTIESVKAASDIYAPVSGKIVEVNEELDSSPEKINDDAEGEGWIVRIEVADESELDSLMDLEAYKKHCEEEG